MEIYIESIGLAAPGLCGWEASQPVFRGETSYEPIPLEKYKPALLPPNERRRATELARLAFRVSEEATLDYSELNQLAAVFASSGGDYQIIDQICDALRRPERMVSPTHFHNSVHNAAAGYWSIATGSMMPSTSLSAYDHTFSAGLLEAATTVCIENRPVLLTVYDTQPPEPLLSKRRITLPYAVALLVTANATPRSSAKLFLTLIDREEETVLKNPALEAVRTANPAARSLPLLEKLSNKTIGEVNFDSSSNQTLKVDVQQCL